MTIIVHSDLYELRLYFKIDDRESGQFTNWTCHLQTDYRQDFAQYEFVFDNTVIYILADLLQDQALLTTQESVHFYTYSMTTCYTRQISW